MKGDKQMNILEKMYGSERIEYERLVRDSEKLRAIIAYIEACEYSIEKDVVLAIAGKEHKKYGCK